MISTRQAILAGLWGAARQPRLLVVLWIVNLGLALPAAALVGASIHGSIRNRTVHEKLTTGFDMGWFGEFHESAEGLERTFRPGVTGAGAFFDNLEGWFTGSMFFRSPVLVGLGLLYLLVWALLMGGILSRLAGVAPGGAGGGLLATGSRFFLRFVRLALLSGGLYAAVYLVHRRLYAWVGEFTRDATSEGTVLVWSVGVTALTGLLLVLVHVVFAYAKIATVLEDRRSMLLAAARGARFAASHPLRTLGLYFALALLSTVLLAIYAAFAPGAEQATLPAVATAFAAGQLLLIARLALRLSLLAGQTALYRARPS